MRPAIRPATTTPKTRGDGPLRVLFVGTAFYEKGGIEALEAAPRAKNVQLDLISYVPPEVEIPANVTVHVPGPRELVERLYAECHVLLFPSHMDTFGYVVLEAMAHGLPVLAPGHLALNELIDDDSGVRFAPENMLYGDDGLCRFDYTNPLPSAYLASAADTRASPTSTGSSTRWSASTPTTTGSRRARWPASAGSMDHRRAQLARIYGAATS